MSLPIIKGFHCVFAFIVGKIFGWNNQKAEVNSLFFCLKWSLHSNKISLYSSLSIMNQRNVGSLLLSVPRIFKTIWIPLKWRYNNTKICKSFFYIKISSKCLSDICKTHPLTSVRQNLKIKIRLNKNLFTIDVIFIMNFLLLNACTLPRYTLLRGCRIR